MTAFQLTCSHFTIMYSVPMTAVLHSGSDFLLLYILPVVKQVGHVK